MIFGAFIVLLNVLSGSSFDYCKLCETHTMCKFKTLPGNSCLNHDSTKMTTHLQTLIVNTHNKLRSNVALGLIKVKDFDLPPASNMLGLIWDNELAMIAQRWADTCVPQAPVDGHDECRKTTRFDVGQNVYGYKSNSTAEPNFISIIMEWYNEFNKFNISGFDNLLTTDYESFLQIIWSKTNFIGCGHSSFQDPNDDHSFLHKFVCNYGPSSSVERKAPYKAGEPCSECPNSFKCDSHFPGICFEERALEVENRIRELVKTVNELITQRSKQRLKHVNNGTNSQITDFSYTDVIIDYLAKALEYHKDRFDQLSDASDGLDAVEDVFVEMNEFNKSYGPIVMHSEYANDSIATKYKKVDGIWNEGSCRCNYVFRSSASTVAANVVLLLSLITIRICCVTLR